MNEELKPCPFCGGEPYIDSYDRIITIGCKPCGYRRNFHWLIQSEIDTGVPIVYKSGKVSDSEWYDRFAHENAIEAWNRRANDTNVDSMNLILEECNLRMIGGTHRMKEARIKMYKPLNMFTAQIDELKRLIAKYPDYPIVVLCSSEVVADDDYNWWYAPDIRFDIGEILDCDQNIDETKVYTDRDDFEDAIRDRLSWDVDYDYLSDEEFDKAVQKKLEEYDPYWRKVIQIKADV